MSKTAFIFPGQGAQYIGMGKDFYEEDEEIRDSFHLASDILGYDVTKLLFEDNEKINQTKYTQALLVTVCNGILMKVKEMGITCDVSAGLSLGEYMALINSGVLSFLDALRIVSKRGTLMEEAVEPSVGGMSAVLGLSNEVIESITKSIDGVWIANYNCEGQSVITGKKEALLKAAELLKEAGAKRVLPLTVSGPFHSPLLQEAGEQLLSFLENIEIHTPNIPYVTNVTASFVDTDTKIKELLSKQVYSSVLWQQSVETMIKNGVTTFIEIGPGKTLSSLVKKIDKNVTVLNIEKVADLDKLTTI